MKRPVGHLPLRIPRLALALLAGLVLAGCNLPGPATAAPTFVFPTLTALQPLPSATPLAPTSTLPAPTATTAPAGTRISFAAGATSDVEQGTLQPGQTQKYLLAAGGSQPLIINVDSPNQDLSLSIAGLTTNNVLLDASKKWNAWEGILPASQDYLVTVYAGAAAQNYTLSVIIPARVVFAQGATSKKLSGITPNGLNVDYVIYAQAGQKMTQNLTVPANTAALTVYGFQDGQPLLRSIMNTTSWSESLPVTEDYILEVVPFAGAVVNYTLDVEVK